VTSGGGYGELQSKKGEESPWGRGGAARASPRRPADCGTREVYAHASLFVLALLGCGGDMSGVI
jgi:hypothetical protein